MIPDMLEMTITDGPKWFSGPLGFKLSWRRGRKATVVKYTEVTSVLKVFCQSSTDSAFQSLSLRSSALLSSGGALGPEMPALQTGKS